MTERVNLLLTNKYNPSVNPCGLIFLDSNDNKLVSLSKTFRRIVDGLFNQNITDSR